MANTSRIADGAVVAFALGALALTAYRFVSQESVSTAAASATIPSLDSLRGTTLRSLPVLLDNGGIMERTFADSSEVLIVFFRSTCPACETTAPIWRELVTRKSPKTRFVAISVEGMPTARAWLDRHGLKPDEVLIPQEGPQTVFDRWGITGVPLTVSLRPGGKIHRAQLGVLAPQRISEFLPGNVPSVADESRKE